MDLMVVSHIAAGGTGIVAGFVALYTTKGATVHRRAGTIFVWVMLAMTSTGVLLAALRGAMPQLNIPAGLVTAYLVVTSYATVRPLPRGGRLLDVSAMLLALAVGIFSMTQGFATVVVGEREGIPAFPYFLFGVVALLGSALDLRMIRKGALQGIARLRRHLWRMSFALFIAAMSFFLGQADEIPKAIRIPWLLALPVLAVLITMFYWLWRVRRKRPLRGAAGAAVAETS